MSREREQPVRARGATPTRMSRRRVWGIVLVAVAAVTLFSVLVPVHITSYADTRSYVFLIGGALCGALPLALRLPRLAIAVFTVAATALPAPIPDAAASLPWPWSPPAMVSLFVLIIILTRRSDWRMGLAAWLLPVLGTLSLGIDPPGAVSTAAAIANLVIVTSVGGGVLLLSMLLQSLWRARADLSRERLATASEQSRRLLVEERTRIARELHDVVAHSMSVIQVQSSTARYRVDGLPESALSEFEDIAATARSALTEMRRLLGVLRTEDQAAPTAPQQGIVDIPALVEGIRRTGGVVQLVTVLPDAVIPSGTDVAAFRIVQESLSNALRHAPGAAIAVRISMADGGLQLSIRNDPPTRAPMAAHSSSGHGILGMRERAAMLDGTLVAGPDDRGGWSVSAALPLDANQEIR